MSSTEHPPDDPDDGAGDGDVDDEDIVIPRASPLRTLKFVRGVDLFRVALFALMLVMILMLRQPCADGVGRFIGSFDQQPPPPAADAGAAEQTGQQKLGRFRRLTDEEIKAIFSGDAGAKELMEKDGDGDRDRDR